MYKLTSTSTIVRVADGANIPADPANADYADYLAWLAQNNTPLPADIPPPPTKDQQIAALLAQFGITQEWQLDRDIGYAQSLAQLAGITEPQLYASNVAYRMSKDLKTQIDAIRAAP